VSKESLKHLYKDEQSDSNAPPDLGSLERVTRYDKSIQKTIQKLEVQQVLFEDV
jgi:hypothetical protein